MRVSRARALEPLRVRSVLLPLDGSPLAEQALPWATAIARKSRARLRLALVHQTPSPPPLDESTARLYTRIELALRKSQRDYLRRVARRIKEEDEIQVVTATLSGPPAPTLLDYAREVGVDLVVMTTHGRGGLQRAWLGSVADQLLRSLAVPLLLIRPSDGTPRAAPEPTLEEILVPLDGSRRAEAALPAATGLAMLFRAGLTLVQSVEPVAMTDLPMAYPPALDEEITAVRRREAQDYLDDVAEAVAELGVTARATTVLSGGALEGIRAATRGPKVGMIALATHGRGGLRRLVLGSVADKLVRTGELPVLLTRPRGK
ncbi:MAG: universal stress protein [Gemmatimonadales bacterium]